MYLSRLKLDSMQRKTRELLISPYTLHQAVYRAFPDKSDGGPGRVLYRVDSNRRSSALSLIVQSDVQPDWARADFLQECLAGEHETKLYNPIVSVGHHYRFRLRANPTVKKKDEERKNGYRKGLFREEEQLAWLQRKAETSGFSFVQYCIVTEGMVNEGRNRIGHFGVLFEGILRVTDTELFKATVQKGIGPAKGFGFGLLSITPVDG